MWLSVSLSPRVFSSHPSHSTFSLSILRFIRFWVHCHCQLLSIFSFSSSTTLLSYRDKCLCRLFWILLRYLWKIEIKKIKKRDTQCWSRHKWKVLVDSSLWQQSCAGKCDHLSQQWTCSPHQAAPVLTTGHTLPEFIVCPSPTSSALSD